jgi:hypothetical protein
LPENLFLDVEEEGLKAFRNQKWNAVDMVIMNKVDIVGEDSCYQYEGGYKQDSLNTSMSNKLGQGKDISKFLNPLNFGSNVEKEDQMNASIDYLGLNDEEKKARIQYLWNVARRYASKVRLMTKWSKIAEN